MIDILVDSSGEGVKFFLKRLCAGIKLQKCFEGEESELSSEANIVVFWKSSWNNSANR